MNMRRIISWFYIAIFLAGCANVGGQLQVLSPTEATAITQQNKLPTQESTTIPTTDTTSIPNQISTPTPNAPDGKIRILSPDKRWTAILDLLNGSLEVEDLQGTKQTLFPAGSTVNDVRWSSDSAFLMVAISNLAANSEVGGVMKPPEIRMLSNEGSTFGNAVTIYQAPADDAPGQVILGTWSPDNRRILFWSGPAGASILADGIPLWSLEIESGNAILISESALVNTTYQSWSPDSSAVVFTNGGYRSAQVGKSLSIYDVASGQSVTVVPSEDLVPGQVSWSSDGNTIAFAAVAASQTGPDWADSLSWDNPAIQARRIYLLDASTKQFKRLNAIENYQDAPRWSPDSKTLFYIQVSGIQAAIMSANPVNGTAQALSNCQMALPAEAGYYGQVDWTSFYDSCSATSP